MPFRSQYRDVPPLFGGDGGKKVKTVTDPSASRQAAGGMKRMKGGQTPDDRISKANVKAAKKIERKLRKRRG